MPSDSLTLQQMNRATLARQLLLERAATTPLKAIGRLVALQAQWPRPPFVGLWTRVKGFERAALVAEFQKRRVVRATMLRGTIHVATAADYIALRPAIQPALDAGVQAILKDRLDGVDLPALLKTSQSILKGGPKTFEGIRDAFLEADPSADERALGYAVRMMLPLVQVPEKDTAWAFPAKACFTPAETWLDRKVPTKPEPPDALILRYLEGYGPASAADIQAWSGLPGPSIREALDRLSPKLVTFTGPGIKALYDLPGAPRPAADTPAPVRFLPEYDNVIAARADERIVARAHRPRIFLSALRIAATVLVDGRAAATWTVATSKKRAVMTIVPFATLAPKIRRELVAEGEAVLKFSEPDAPAHDIAIG